MLHQLRNRNFYLILCIDMVLFTVSLFLSYGIRFAFEIPDEEIVRALHILPFVLGLKAVVFAAMGVYRGMWRYTSVRDAVQLGKASLLATLLIIAGIGIISRFQGYPRSVYVADCIFTLFLCSAVRIGIRLFYIHKQKFAGFLKGGMTGRRPGRQVRLLVVGAGDAADKIIREIQGSARLPYDVVCCADDDQGKHGRTLLGVPVRGPIQRLPRFVEQFRADEILIAMPSIGGARMREIIGLCENTRVPFKTLPSLGALIDGRISVNDLRPVNYEDLLGRPPVKLNTEAIGQYLTGKTVAVTGAGGSIGSELCRQIARFNPETLVLIDSSEFNLYRIEMELRNKLQAGNVLAVMGRVQDRSLMARVLQKTRPQVVLHAAACKHVPMVELNPWECVLTNVLGSQVMMDVAEEAGVERFVLVSTDKAVRPTSVMGACKRMAELMLQTRSHDRTRFMAVRFGNVVGSSGSVIPLFRQQIKAGGPLTVTHPEITRYFMTIPEACQLILQAGAMGDGGEIFLLEMGTPVRIADIARDLIRLSGKEPGADIEIVYTGLRPGEKFKEELITEGEGIVPTPHEKIMVLKRHGDSTDPASACRLVREEIEALVRDAESFDAGRIRSRLQSLIPEYTPSATQAVL